MAGTAATIIIANSAASNINFLKVFSFSFCLRLGSDGPIMYLARRFPVLNLTTLRGSSRPIASCRGGEALP